VIVQFLLDEMLDGGRPFDTDPNVLSELINPPDFINRLINIDHPFKSILASEVPSGLFTITPWRKQNVRYASNEIFVDIVEEIDCFMDCNAYIDRCEIWGEVRVNARLTGMPELELEFNHPEMFLDVVFHPCVLLQAYNKNKVLRFIPPDGKFILMNYRIKGQLHPPVQVRPKYDRTQAIITVELKGDRIDNTLLSVPWDSDMALSAISVTKGNVQYNDIERVCKWNLGNLDKGDPQKGITNNTKFTLNASIPRDSESIRLTQNPIKVDFTMKTALSGLRVATLAVHHEKLSAKPFKGLKTMTKAGNYYIQPNSFTSALVTKT